MSLCNKYQPAQPKLPIMQPDLPARPWEKLGTDIFEFNGKKYLMVVDYYPRFPVIRLLNYMKCATTSQASWLSTDYQPPSSLILDLSTSAKSSKQNVNKAASHNLVPRVLSLPRESTLVMAGHVSTHANYRRTEGGSSTKLQLQLQLCSPSFRSYLWNLLKSSRHVTSCNQGTFSR